jgi:hypothetical protein
MPNDLVIPDKLNNKEISLTEMNSSRLPPEGGRPSLQHNAMRFNHPMIPHSYEVETNP